MKTRKLFFVLLSLPVLFFAGCSKDDDKGDALTYKQPAIASRGDVVTIPAGLEAQAGTDFNAAMAVMYMQLANGIGSFAGNFTVPDNAQPQNKKGGSVVYHWSYGGYAYWMTYAETLTKNTWSYDYEFPGYSRFTFMDAEELKNGKAGKWAIYDPENTDHPKVWDYVWTIELNEDFTAVLDMSSDSESSSFEVLARKNNSGNFKYFVGLVKMVDVTWNADGSGNWWMFDGSQELTGTWTAK